MKKGAGFCSLYSEIHYIGVHYIDIWECNFYAITMYCYLSSFLYLHSEQSVNRIVKERRFTLQTSLLLYSSFLEVFNRAFVIPAHEKALWRPQRGYRINPTLEQDLSITMSGLFLGGWVGLMIFVFHNVGIEYPKIILPIFSY